MSTQVQIQGAATATQSVRTLVSRVLDIDTTKKRLNVHDGTTAGGIPHVNYADHQNREFTYAAATGTNTIAITLAKAPAAYAAGQKFAFKALNTISGSATLNVNSLGAKTIKKVSSGALVALASGDIVAGVIYEVSYDGTDMQLASGAGGGGDVSKVRTITISGGATSFIFDSSDFSDTATYDYYIKYRDIRLSGANALILTASKNNGSSYETAYYAESTYRTSGTTTTLQNGSVSSITVGYAIGAGSGDISQNGRIQLGNMGTDGKFMVEEFWGSFIDTGGTKWFNQGMGGYVADEAAFNNVKVAASSGTFTNGSATLYKVKI